MCATPRSCWRQNLNHVTSLFLALPRPLIRRLEMEGDDTCCSVCGLICNGIITREIHPLFHHYFTYDEMTELSFSGFHIRRSVHVFRVFFFFFKGQRSTFIICIINLSFFKKKKQGKRLSLDLLCKYLFINKFKILIIC
jgi:hypothetical protein